MKIKGKNSVTNTLSFQYGKAYNSNGTLITHFDTVD